jgi:hypothetical protein
LTIISKYFISKINFIFNFYLKIKILILFRDYDDLNDDVSNTRFEGYLIKITKSNNYKKIWFKLVYKDLYYYKTKEEKKHKGMHNLTGVFLKTEESIIKDGEILYCFSMIYPQKTRYYYIEKKEEYLHWIQIIQTVIGYSSLFDLYDVKVNIYLFNFQEKLGNGKFGLVKSGIHKKSGRKVAIKIMNKKDMFNEDLNLIKTEIEILKICQHPNIIRLYDVFENLEFIYISKFFFYFFIFYFI